MGVRDTEDERFVLVLVFVVMVVAFELDSEDQEESYAPIYGRGVASALARIKTLGVE